MKSLVALPSFHTEEEIDDCLMRVRAVWLEAHQPYSAIWKFDAIKNKYTAQAKKKLEKEYEARPGLSFNEYARLAGVVFVGEIAQPAILDNS